MDRNRITGAARQTVGRLKDAAGYVTNDSTLRAEGLYDEAVGYGTRVLGQARDHAADLADDAYETGRQLYGQGIRQLQRGAKDHPLALVVAAGIAGAAIAWMLSQPRR
ncbi:CsbD family protein [Ancylobacter sp. 6x-1]|uniref:CsbD family protein n=1 Tax=Ancylobacter crimeensis TaxID=2579147 RepID=A0ABT0DDS9_9HYPH|nr:CsbD family protein [Ancylobacter crimeensis]MCK0198117.1 CsbD family protein [Ancylobacter crimeensis]